MEEVKEAAVDSAETAVSGEKRKLPAAETETADWTWHVCLSRWHRNVKTKDPAARRVDDHREARDLSVGWLLEVHRFQQQDVDEPMDPENAVAPLLLPTKLARRLQQEDQRSMKVLQDHDVRVTSPSMAGLFMEQRALLKWRIFKDLTGFPVNYVKEALGVLSESKWSRLRESGEGDDDTIQDNIMLHELYEELGLTQRFWTEATQQAPSSIRLYLPSDTSEDVVQEIQKVTRQCFPEAAADVCQDWARTSKHWMDRLVWALQFDLRFRTSYLAGGIHPKDKSRGKRDIGTYEYWDDGNTLNVPSNVRGYQHFYKQAARLLALRPWKTFAPFEALQVIVDVNREMMKYKTKKFVLFTGNDPDGADSTTTSPFGCMQILETEAELHQLFGRASMWSQAFGRDSYPDRLFVATADYSEVHFDSILLLEELFGHSLLPKAGWETLEARVGSQEPKTLPVGIIPLMEAETGTPPGYAPDSDETPLGHRPFTDSEHAWTGFACAALQRFVVEEGERSSNNRRSTDGVILRTYPLDPTVSVTVCYNMDRKHGGLWDPEVKWMYF